MSLNPSKHLNEDTVIWKYFDFASFTSLLLDQNLIFRRFDLFEDKLEGTLSKLAERQMFEHFCTKSCTENEAIKHTNDERVNIENYKKFTYANCWSINEHENYALWKIYLKGERNGVAIKTTIGELKNRICPFPTDEHPKKAIHIQDVNYEPFSYDETNQNKVFTSKNKEYAYESELRLLIKYQRDFYNRETLISKGFNDNQIIKVPIDLRVIQTIHVSPFSEPWFMAMLKKLVALPDFNIGKEIEILNSSIVC